MQDAGSAAKKAATGAAGDVTRMSIVDGFFKDDRWVDGTWDFAQFKAADGETDWDAVIDAEMERRRMLEDSPIPSRNEDPVNFDTNMVPWWAWVKRFHLPEAEKLNGRAAMVGYLFAGVVDLASGAGLVEQQARSPAPSSLAWLCLRSPLPHVLVAVVATLFSAAVCTGPAVRACPVTDIVSRWCPRGVRKHSLFAMTTLVCDASSLCPPCSQLL